LPVFLIKAQVRCRFDTKKKHLQKRFVFDGCFLFAVRALRTLPGWPLREAAAGRRFRIESMPQEYAKETCISSCRNRRASAVRGFAALAAASPRFAIIKRFFAINSMR
jgi:hypothetical protein